jgi:hypothetical protein
MLGWVRCVDSHIFKAIAPKLALDVDYGLLVVVSQGPGAPDQYSPIVGPPRATHGRPTGDHATHYDAVNVLLAACSHKSVHLMTMILIILIRIIKQLLTFNRRCLLNTHRPTASRRFVY